MAIRIAIVTGTSSGIGKALTERLLADGWKVVGVARREANFEGDYQHIQADLSDPSAVVQLGPRLGAEMAFGEFSRLALVNNAATPGQKRSYGEQSDQDTFRNMAINLAAPIALMDMAVRLRPESAALRVINLSSGLAFQPLASMADYCASKAGLHMAGEVLATEGHLNTAVLSYAPGIVDTEMQQSLRAEQVSEFASADVFRVMHEEGQLVTTEAVIEPIVAFLESDTAGGFHQDRYEA